MSEKAKWIWYSGDFELYHHMLLSCRRQELGLDYPCAWRVARPELNVVFYKRFDVPEDGVMHVYSHSKGYVGAAGIRYPVNTDIPYKKGKLEIEVCLYDIEGFPSLFIDDKYVKTDSTWVAGCTDTRRMPVGCEPAYTSAQDDPKIFPFEYKEIFPCSEEKINGGILYDFGRESFGKIIFDSIEQDDEITLSYGESKEEALDFDNAIVREQFYSCDEKERPSRAFRYIFIKSRSGRAPSFSAMYEYLPIEDIASFECDRELVKKIWDVSSYTFHLNSREFYLDGIKRDRWVWSGDAYQSFIINRYLYSEPGITRRTITALLGKPEYHCHINTINDYSAFLIIAVWEYYFSTGDKAFVESVWGKVRSLCGFIMSRLDENGYVVRREGDWIFIDWGDVDKSGTLCAEQLLLWKMYCSMAKLCELTGEENNFFDKAEKLKSDIIRDYWKEEKSCFIDCFDSEKEHISRQTNVLAVMLDFVSRETAQKIKESVFDNDSITQITTPYFKLYELTARCMCGDIESMQSYLEEYWGGMLSLGATSVWEQYNPLDEGEKHYGMYGKKYDKSLCHAWGSGPVYLLGRFCAGVEQTGCDSFRVSPQRGIYKFFKAVVPVNGKKVSVEFSENSVSVLTDAEGGVLCFKGKEYPLTVNEKVTVSF